MLIFEDVAYRELAFDGGALPSLWSLGPDVVLQAGTFSKVLSPGVRLGWAAGPPAVVAQLAAAKQTTDQCAGALGQRMLEEYGRAGHFERRLPAARELYASHWRALERAFVEHLPPGCEWTTPAGGFLTWLALPPDVDVLALRPAATAAGVAYVPGPPFYSDERGRNEMRLSFSHLGAEELGEAVRRLAIALRAAPPRAPGSPRPARAVAERLQADVVGARVEVRPDRLGDRLRRPVRDHRVDQPVAAAVGDVRARCSRRQQVARVVAALEVAVGVLAASPRAVSGSRSTTTASSGATSASGPIRSRAKRVCSTGVKYGWVPSERSAARSSIFGPSAAAMRPSRGTGARPRRARRRTRASWPAARYSRVASGWPMPMPSRKRSGNAARELGVLGGRRPPGRAARR